jgi:hypothetical protein
MISATDLLRSVICVSVGDLDRVFMTLKESNQDMTPVERRDIYTETDRMCQSEPFFKALTAAAWTCGRVHKSLFRPTPNAAADLAPPLPPAPLRVFALRGQ